MKAHESHTIAPKINNQAPKTGIANLEFFVSVCVCFFFLSYNLYIYLHFC